MTKNGFTEIDLGKINDGDINNLTINEIRTGLREEILHWRELETARTKLTSYSNQTLKYYVDASKHAYGIRTDMGSYITGTWNTKEATFPIHHKECLVVSKCIQNIPVNQINTTDANHIKRVIIYNDNNTVVLGWNKRKSNDFYISTHFKAWFSWAEHFKIHLILTKVDTVLNLADEPSRFNIHRSLTLAKKFYPRLMNVLSMWPKVDGHGSRYMRLENCKYISSQQQLEQDKDCIGFNFMNFDWDTFPKHSCKILLRLNF